MYDVSSLTSIENADVSFVFAGDWPLWRGQGEGPCV